AAMVVVVLFELLLLPQAPATRAITAISAAGTARCRLRVRLVSVIGFMGRTVREPGGAGAPTRETGGEQRANLGVARGAPTVRLRFITATRALRPAFRRRSYG